MDGFTPANKIGTSSTGPYFYTQASFSNVPSGYHSIGANAIDSAGNSNFIYVGVSINEASTGTTRCEDAGIDLYNALDQRITGGLWGMGFGSAGYYVEPYSWTHVSLPAGLSDTFVLQVHMQIVGNESQDVSCSSMLTTQNRCPLPGTQNAIVTLLGSSCSIYVNH